MYPLGACGAPIRSRGIYDAAPRLRRLIPWLDYVQRLGLNGVLLGPIFESVAHGYDTLDHFRIDARLGDEAVFAEFIAAAHARGIEVILDGVFNHVAVTHPFVTGELPAGSRLAGYCGPRGSGGPVKRDATGNTAAWEGDGTLAELDHADSRCVDFVVDVMRYWLDRGIAGWRLDVAYAVPGSFWREVIARVRETHPEARFVGEMIHGDYPGFARDSGIDAITQYELWKAIWSSITDANFFELAHALGRHQDFASAVWMQTFVGNHDVDRIAGRVGGAGAALAAAILFTVPGLPSVYYGDEQAFRGVKGEGWEADDQLRPPLPRDPSELSPLGEWMHQHYQALIALRRRCPWIAWGDLEVLHTENKRIRYRVRGSDPAQEVVTELQVNPARVRIWVAGAEEFRFDH